MFFGFLWIYAKGDDVVRSIYCDFNKHFGFLLLIQHNLQLAHAVDAYREVTEPNIPVLYLQRLTNPLSPNAHPDIYTFIQAFSSLIVCLSLVFWLLSHSPRLLDTRGESPLRGGHENALMKNATFQNLSVDQLRLELPHTVVLTLVGAAATALFGLKLQLPL